VGKSQFSKIYIIKKHKKQKGKKNEMDWAVLAQLQGWTQPSRVGWADVPACNKKRAGLSPAAWAALMFQPAGEGKKPMTSYCA
jgi:hypothetical protein